jgi:two-component system, response regulator
MNKRLLLVEDNPADEKLTLRVLRKHPVAIDIEIARDGVEALDYLLGSGRHAGRDVSIQPDVVLLDLKMPRLNGLEVLARMRSDDRTRWVPVVILTASREEPDVLQSYRLGVNAYIRKPVDFSEFSESARVMTWFWLVLNERPPRHRGEP